jgi:retinol dehydrogenase 12
MKDLPTKIFTFLATNAVGPAILTLLLLDVLVRTARQTAGKHSVRIVQTSSSAERLLGTGPPKQSWESLEHVNREQKSTWSRYGQSKVANVLLAKGLTRILADENIW